ncbi:keratin-associated protein 10-4 isoform X1 [Hydra vulgaris]|uniref:keratin-associated protein 10-4 isoform X1 n=1 Tax=Hydra vulgaris TaxID=6087 RepID=UPI001F5F82BE|nr:keratin-associated protein 10-4 [Hydra vulgaris]
MRFVQQIRLTFLFIYPAVALWLNKLPISKFPDDVDHAVAGCQEDNLYLQCQNRYNKLNISKVFYGRDDTTICTSRVLESKKICNHTTPNSVIEKVILMCSGENRCKIPVTPEFLEMKDNMICPDIRKYLKVFYTCRQNTNINEVCKGGCSSKCYPDCSESCCKPPSLTQAVTSSNYITSTCPGNCPQSCAPMCQPTCCQSSIALKTPNFCPNGCQSLCAPLCSPSCCLFRAVPTANLQEFKQPVPKLQYDVFRCDNGCNKACAPLCQPTCCESHRMLLQAAKVERPSCPSTCINNCNSNCPSNCCKSYHYPLPITAQGSNIQNQEPVVYQASSYNYVQPPQAQSFYQKECTLPCSAGCAPYCTPECCSRTQPQIITQVTWCPLPCSPTCAPACDSACCNPQTSSQESQQPYQYVMPQQYMQTPQQYLQNPQIPISSSTNLFYNNPVSPVYPVQTGNSYTDVSSSLGSQYMPYISMPQQPTTCPIGCKSTCMSYCPQYCCRENINKVDLYKTKELLQRKKYQQVLANFRAKQIQKYYQG